MSADEVFRLKRDANIPDLFRNRPYSRSWVLGSIRDAADTSEGN